MTCSCGSVWSKFESGAWEKTVLGRIDHCKDCEDLLRFNHIRPELADFVWEMEALLRKHDEKKRGWELEDENWLMRRLLDEIGEVIEAVNPTMGGDQKAVIRYLLGELMRLTYRTTSRDPKLVQRELIDVANFCMFLHYRLGVKANG